MNVIDYASYYALAVDYGRAIYRSNLVADSLYDAVYTIVQLDEVDPEVDLLNAFNENYKLASITQNSRSAYLTPVRSLQLHVLTRSTPTIDDINTYVEQVYALYGGLPSEFADLSSDAGYEIDPEYIEENFAY